MDRNTLFASVAIFVVGCLIGLHLIYLPKMEELRVLRERQREEENRQLLLNEIAALEKKVNAYQEHRFPSGKEEVELLNLIREIAAEAKVRMTSMTPEAEREKKKKKYRKFSLIISFEGTYHLLGDFVAKIESAPKVIKIESLEFKASQAKGDIPLECTMTLSIFSVS